MKKLFALSVICISLAACDQPPVNRDGTKPLTTVASVDVKRYLGTWYEIARYDHEFERNCTGVTATYSLNPDGTIKVLNRCHRGSLSAAADDAEGTARIVDKSTNAKLGVTFFWPFEGDYWILELDPEYQWAVVGEPSGRYLWILSRSPQIGDDLRSSLLGKIEAHGYRTNALIWTPQGEKSAER